MIRLLLLRNGRSWKRSGQLSAKPSILLILSFSGPSGWCPVHQIPLHHAWYHQCFVDRAGSIASDAKCIGTARRTAPCAQPLPQAGYMETLRWNACKSNALYQDRDCHNGGGSPYPATRSRLLILSACSHMGWPFYENTPAIHHSHEPLALSFQYKNLENMK